MFVDKNWSVNTKISRDISKGLTFLHQKYYVNSNGWRVNGFINYDMTSFVLNKFGVLVGWTPENNWSYNLHFQNPKKPEKLSPAVILSNACLNINKKISDTQTVGLEVSGFLYRLVSMFLA